MTKSQLISMDAGDLLPPEMAVILARLRSDAHAMPQRQVQAVLTANWGAQWQQRFEPFSFTPVAAASIGQVHRARTLDGRDLAIKIQYPGVRASISSDVDNVATLLRLSGLLPGTLDIAPLLLEAKRQLREEADYQAEGAHLQRFADLLADAPEFVVPRLHADLTTPQVLAMSFVGGVPIESMVHAPQAERDRIVRLLLKLLFRELFEFGLMQTDPNFANYRYDRATGQLILLDFGATRAFAPGFGRAYGQLMAAATAGPAGSPAQGAGQCAATGASCFLIHPPEFNSQHNRARPRERHQGRLTQAEPVAAFHRTAVAPWKARFFVTVQPCASARACPEKTARMA